MPSVCAPIKSAFLAGEFAHFSFGCLSLSGFGYKNKWLRASKAIEYYIDGGPWAASSRDSENQLYCAVADGEVRSRVDGNPFDPKELKGKSFADDRLYVLPYELEVNLEDVERIWDWNKSDLADMIARGLVFPSSAITQLEVNNLNLQNVLRRVEIRLAAIPLEQALKETGFQDRFAQIDRAHKLLVGANLVPKTRLLKLVDEFDHLLAMKDRMLERFSVQGSKRGKGGRKPTYDWAAAREHIKEKFQHHGALSPDDPDWSCQADVEREIQRFFFDRIGREPVLSTAREKARRFIQDLGSGLGDN